MVMNYEIFLPHSLYPISITCQEPIDIDDAIIIGGCVYTVTKKAFKLQGSKVIVLLSVVERQEAE